MNGIFSDPLILLINILGHVLDSLLFVYLVNHFFIPRKGGQISLPVSLTMGGIMAAALFLADLLSGNAFYLYYGMMLLLPVGYACLFFRERFWVKLTICTIFTTFLLSLEMIFITLTFEGDFSSMDASGRTVLSFLIRRILLKGVIFLFLSKAFLWPRKETLSFPRAYWILLFCLSLGENIILICVHPEGSLSMRDAMLLRLFFALVPVAELLIIKNISLSAEKARVAYAQAEQERERSRYLASQVEMMESLRKFRHDYKGHLFTLDALLQEGKTKEMHDYLVSLHQVQYEGVTMYRYCEEASLNVLLNQKATMAARCGIDFRVDVDLPQVGRITMADLTSLVANLCDNAIEACALLPEGFVDLSIHKNKAYLIIEVTNACHGNVLQDNPYLRTSKGNSQMHGIGISIIEGIAEKYQGTCQVKGSEGRFSTSILLLDE